MHKLRRGIIALLLLSIPLLFLAQDENTKVLLTGFVLIVLIIFIMTGRLFHIARNIGLIALIVMIWFVSFEVVVQVLRENCIVFECSQYETEVDKEIAKYAKFLKSLYSDEEWVEQFSLELATIMRRENRFHHYPYISTRTIPYNGEFASINRDGLRPIPQSECNEESYRVYVMGNSTLWGTYEPNHLTLAALLQEELAQKLSVPVCLINYAQGSWNSTQELMQLILLIQANDIPDLVIYYDGAVDILSAQSYKQSSIPPGTQGKARILGEKRTSLSLDYYFYSLLAHTRLGNIIIENAQIEEPEISVSWPNYLLHLPTDFEILPADVYLANYELSAALADRYDFDFAMFTQPIAFWGNKTLTDKELDQTKNWLGGYKDLYVEMYSQLDDVADDYDYLYFLGHIFDDITEMVYVDSMHILPEMNEIVAQEIANIVEISFFD